MANKLGRGLSALFGDVQSAEIEIFPDVSTVSNLTENKIANKKHVTINRSNNNVGILILPAKNEEAIEIANSIEQAIGLPTSLTITRKGGRLSIQCKTYEELEMLVKKLTADEQA